MATPNAKKTLNLTQRAAHYGEKALKFCYEMIARFGQANQVAENNYALGMRHLNLGNYGDAVFRFKAVTWLKPKNAAAWYQLGNAYLADRQPSLAASAYRQALAIKPEHEEAAYMLAIARGKKATPAELPKKIPASLLASHFENIAAGYDEDQLKGQVYRGHILLAEAIGNFATPGRMDHAVLDLGCGTGLCAPLLRPIASHITGVDIAQNMLTQAMALKDGKDKRIYDELIKREAHEFLKDAYGEHYDIAIAGGLVSFVGDSAALVAGIARAMKRGGLFAFTADIYSGQQGYAFDPEAGRFRFAKSYLEQLASANGVQILKLDQTEIYPGYPMWLGVFKK